MMPSVKPDRQLKSVVLTKALLRAAGILGISNSKLARILGLSPSTITRLVTGTYVLVEGKKEWEFAALLVRMFRSLDAITGGNEEIAAQWMRSENKALAGRKPVELLENVEGLVRVVTYLDSIRGVV
jgi:uncharacterized protein (DUF2384 family)